MTFVSHTNRKRPLMSCLGCIALSLFWISRAAAQQADPLEQQLKELKQEYETTTQALQLRMAILEQQIESQKEIAQKTKEATVSAADLAAERAAKAVLRNSDQVGAKFQGDLPSEPTYDLLREADETITKLKEQVGTFEFHGFQPAGIARFRHLRKLVRRISRFGRRDAVPESNEWTDVRSPNRDLVVEPRATGKVEAAPMSFFIALGGPHAHAVEMTITLSHPRPFVLGNSEHFLQQTCHLDRSVAKWRDLRFPLSIAAWQEIRVRSPNRLPACQGRHVRQRALRHLPPDPATVPWFRGRRRNP